MSALLTGLLVARCLATAASLPADAASDPTLPVEVLVAQNGARTNLLLVDTASNRVVAFPKAQGVFTFHPQPNTSFASLSASDAASGLSLSLDAGFQMWITSVRGTLTLRQNGEERELVAACTPVRALEAE